MNYLWERLFIKVKSRSFENWIKWNKNKICGGTRAWNSGKIPKTHSKKRRIVSSFSIPRTRKAKENLHLLSVTRESLFKFNLKYIDWTKKINIRNWWINQLKNMEIINVSITYWRDSVLEIQPTHVYVNQNSKKFSVHKSSIQTAAKLVFLAGMKWFQWNFRIFGMNIPSKKNCLTG